MESYSICECGAITIYFANGASNSIRKENLDRFGIDLTNVKKTARNNILLQSLCQSLGLGYL